MLTFFHKSKNVNYNSARAMSIASKTLSMIASIWSFTKIFAIFNTVSSIPKIGLYFSGIFKLPSYPPHQPHLIKAETCR